MDEEGTPWELLYNLGTALVQRGAAGDAAIAEKCLEQAGEVCREVRRSVGFAWLLGGGGVAVTCDIKQQTRIRILPRATSEQRDRKCSPEKTSFAFG